MIAISKIIRKLIVFLFIAFLIIVLLILCLFASTMAFGWWDEYSNTTLQNNQNLKKEAIAITNFPKSAKRIGNNLVLYANGQVIKTYKNELQKECIEGGECFLTYFYGSVEVYNRYSNKINALPIIHEIFIQRDEFTWGIQDAYSVIDIQGHELTLINPKLIPSPDKKYIANYDLYNLIFDLENEPITIHFLPSCIPEKWNSSTELLVRCKIEENMDNYEASSAIEFKAIVYKNQNEWLLRRLDNNITYKAEQKTLQ